MFTEPIETWRQVWRAGFAPALPAAGLEALAAALAADDPRLLQGSTTAPPPLMCHQDDPCAGACALGFVGWLDGTDRHTVGQVEEFFAHAFDEATGRVGDFEPVRDFLNWFDHTPRDVMRAELLAEVERELARRREETELADRRADDVVYFGPDPDADDTVPEPTPLVDPEPADVHAPDMGEPVG